MGSERKDFFTGVFTLFIEKGKPYRLVLDDNSYDFYDIPRELSSEDLFYAWYERVRPEDRHSVEHSIEYGAKGIQSEVRYLWRHEKRGWICLNSMGIISDRTDGLITIKGFTRLVSSADGKTPGDSDKDAAILKAMLVDVMVDNYSLCALANTEKNTVFFLRNEIYPELLGSCMTYDEWRELLLPLIFTDDADKFRRMTARQKMPEYFQKNNGEYLIEVRYLSPNTKKYRLMKQRYMHFDTPLAGEYTELIVFNYISDNRGESYMEALRKRLVDALALPYKKVDLVNLFNGRFYSSRNARGDYTDSFEEMGVYDEFLERYFKECEMTEEELENARDKLLTKNLRRHLSSGEKVLELELKHKTDDGGLEWIRLQAFQAAADEKRNPYMAVVTVMPINEEKERSLRERRKLEYALRSERQYKQAILSTAMAVYTYNVTADILYEEIIEQDGVNALLPLIGLSTPCSYNEYIDKKSCYFTSTEEAGIFRKTFRTESLEEMFSCRRYTMDYEYEFEIDGKRGVFREAVILTKELETNEIWGLTCIRNVTHERDEIKRVEQALRDAFLQAQRANSAKTLFMSQMSHDIRTPLNSILGMAAIAREHIDDKARLLDCMDKIDYAGRNLLEIINNVLDMSAIESGKTVLSQEDFNLGVFLADTVNMIMPLIEKRRHTLRTDFGEIHDDVNGDRAKLRQLLMNVLGNAVKYTDEGGRISFSARELEPDRNGVCRYMFIVEDNGVGMSQEFIEKIFQPFMRADDRRIGNVQGTGLGMAIAQNYARMMNGDIRVTSKVGVGSRFEITVCLKRGNGNGERILGDISLDEAKKIRMSDFDFSGRRVLIAEDLAFNAEIAAEFLGEARVSVETASNGAEAVRMFSQSEPGYYDLIFMDIQMPELDGYAATKVIRSLDREDAQTIPIVAMTANAFIEDIRRARECGMNGHIAKPIEIPGLAAVLCEYFGEK